MNSWNFLFWSCECNVDELCADEGLLVRNVGLAAAGIYQCFVSNAAGTVSAAATVSVSVRDPAQRNSQGRQQLDDVQNIAPDSTYLCIAVCLCQSAINSAL